MKALAAILILSVARHCSQENAMSIAFYWQPTQTTRLMLTGPPADNTPCTFHETLAAVFGGPPVTLSENVLPVLYALDAAERVRNDPQTRHQRTAWDRLAKAIETHGSIQVTAQA